jgi:hypothetical protein
MLSSGTKRYHLELILSPGTTCYHLGLHVIIWDVMFSSGANVIIWNKMLSSGANVIMVSSGAIVIIWCYHVMLSSGMITHPFFIFPENFTHSPSPPNLENGTYVRQQQQLVRLIPTMEQQRTAVNFSFYTNQLQGKQVL